MNILIILAHPDPGSFNHAIARAAADAARGTGCEVILRDLYAERFEPNLSAGEIPTYTTIPDYLKPYCRELAEADGIIIVHPNWWGQPPAILKGWVDRVVRPEVAYRFLQGDSGDGVPTGLLKARFALVFNTSNTSAEREERVFGDPLEAFWKNCIFEFCGVKEFYRKMFRIVILSSEEDRRTWLDEVKEAVTGYCSRL